LANIATLKELLAQYCWPSKAVLRTVDKKQGNKYKFFFFPLISGFPLFKKKLFRQKTFKFREKKI
jgi:hypothetical protein